VKTYDESQITAPLIACADCGRSYYMTKPRRLCVECLWRSRSAQPPQREAGDGEANQARNRAHPAGDVAVVRVLDGVVASVGGEAGLGGS